MQHWIFFSPNTLAWAPMTTAVEAPFKPYSINQSTTEFQTLNIHVLQWYRICVYRTYHTASIHNLLYSPNMWLIHLPCLYHDLGNETSCNSNLLLESYWHHRPGFIRTFEFQHNLTQKCLGPHRPHSTTIYLRVSKTVITTEFQTLNIHVLQWYRICVYRTYHTASIHNLLYSPNMWLIHLPCLYHDLGNETSCNSNLLLESYWHHRPVFIRTFEFQHNWTQKVFGPHQPHSTTVYLPVSKTVITTEFQTLNIHVLQWYRICVYRSYHTASIRNLLISPNMWLIHLPCLYHDLSKETSCNSNLLLESYWHHRPGCIRTFEFQHNLTQKCLGPHRPHSTTIYLRVSKTVITTEFQTLNIHVLQWYRICVYRTYHTASIHNLLYSPNMWLKR